MLKTWGTTDAGGAQRPRSLKESCVERSGQSPQSREGSYDILQPPPSGAALVQSHPVIFTVALYVMRRLPALSASEITDGPEPS